MSAKNVVDDWEGLDDSEVSKFNIQRKTKYCKIIKNEKLLNTFAPFCFHCQIIHNFPKVLA